jgi:signal peptidase II
MISKKNIYSFFFVIVIFFIDRVTKILIINSANLNEEVNLYITHFLSLNLIWNQGIAFGLFSFDQKIYYNLLTGIIIIISLIIAWMILKTKNLEKIGFIMVLGGSLGNVFDRIYYSRVPDFIDLHYNNFHWFIFNVADIFISLGVILLIYSEIFLKKKK